MGNSYKADLVALVKAHKAVCSANEDYREVHARLAGSASWMLRSPTIVEVEGEPYVVTTETHLGSTSLRVNRAERA